MRDSLWTRTTLTQRPALAGDVEADVCVIGGGLAGLTSALLLARGGLSVVLLEARRVGQGTTGRSTAKVTLLQGTRASEIAKTHGAELARRYVEANREGQAWLRHF